MRKYLVIWLLTTCCCLQLQLASAQSAEVEQLMLNIEKLSQLKQVLSDMKKGYETLSNGYGRIKDIAQGNFKLHEVFLDGLLLVNPELRKYRKVKDIIEYQLLLLKEYQSAFGRFSSGGNFRAEEIAYLSKVYAGLFDRSIQNLDELAMVMTSSKLRMSDDERLEAIDRIYIDMREKLGFLVRFNEQAAILDKQREELLKTAKTMKSLIGQ
jgi:hypothetical protein